MKKKRNEGNGNQENMQCKTNMLCSLRTYRALRNSELFYGRKYM